MAQLAIYEFPQLKDLPDGLNIDMFRVQHSVYTPGCHFKATDIGEYYQLKFLHRDVEYNDEFFIIDTNNVVTVKCKKVRSME